MRETETSAPSLGELSEAATQGEWHVDMFPYFDTETSEPQISQCEGICTHDEAASLGDSIATCGEREAAFIIALVNAFRAGRLIDPTAMAEAVASARAEGVKEGLERAAEQIRAAHEFVARHPALDEADQAELRAFMAIPAMFNALWNGGSSDV